jgi:hypothetical protein
MHDGCGRFTGYALGRGCDIRRPSADRLSSTNVKFFVAFLALGATAVTAEEPNQSYVLCEETSASSEARSAVYIFDFTNNVFYPVAYASVVTRFSATPNEIVWQDRDDKLMKDGAYHVIEEKGRLNRMTGIGEKTVSITTPTGTNITVIALKCFSAKGRF